MEFGHAFGQFMIAANAAREGARFGSRYPWDLGTWTPPTGVRGAVYNQCAGTGVTVEEPVITCIDTGGATVSCGSETTPPPKGSAIRVVVEYKYMPILSSVTGLGSPIPIRTAAEMIIFGVK